MKSIHSKSSAFASVAAALFTAATAAASGFLSTGPGARAASMGGAFTALADDSSAIYYNPAGLASQRGALMLEHIPINESGTGFSFNDGRLDFLGLDYPSDYGTFGFGFYQFAIGGIEGRTHLADAATTLNVSQTAYFLPYAFRYRDVAFGVTGKAVNYSLAGSAGTGFGTDVGAKATLFRGDTLLGRDTQLFAGGAIRNIIAPTFTLYQDPTALERTTTVGLALTSFAHEHYESANDHVNQDRLTLTMDASLGNQDSGFTMAFGAEYAYLNCYSIRGGLNSDRNVTVGVGAGGPASTFRFDYAAVLSPLAPQQHFTISWLFTAPETAIESDVHLSAYRRAVLDQERLRDRFVREGRSAAAEGRYDAALVDFEKAQTLDTRNAEIEALVQSSREGSRLAGVKELIDSARREHSARNEALAAKNVINAVLLDPESHEAADYAVQLRNEMIATEGPAPFDMARGVIIDSLSHQFEDAAKMRNIYRMRWVVVRIKAVVPDDSATWQPLEEKTSWTATAWLAEYAAAAAKAYDAHDAVAMARAIRRIRRIDPQYKDLRALARNARKLSRKVGSSFYDSNYLRQLYDTAAAGYVLADYDTAAQNLAVLMRANAAHEDGNALIDQMRNEGDISEDQEP
jgi:hypothetical protein